MNLFDVIILVIFGYCLIRGLFRGLIKELASIVGVLSGFYAAYTYYQEVARLMSEWISNEAYLNIVSFLIIFCFIFFFFIISCLPTRILSLFTSALVPILICILFTN